MKATAFWQLPTMQGAHRRKRVLAGLVNDWQFSSIWTAATGTPYRRHVTPPRTAETM